MRADIVYRQIANILVCLLAGSQISGMFISKQPTFLNNKRMISTFYWWTADIYYFLLKIIIIFSFFFIIFFYNKIKVVAGNRYPNSFKKSRNKRFVHNWLNTSLKVVTRIRATFCLAGIF
jgi:hypothetical protein